MKYFVYILYSHKFQKSYVGYTHDIRKRIWGHNHSDAKSYTARFRPWVIIYSESYETKKEAIIREKWFKTGVGRELKMEIIRFFLAGNEVD